MNIIFISTALISFIFINPALGITPEAMLCEVNKFRASHGVAPLGLDPNLVKAASNHSNDMASRGVMSHNGRDGSTVSTRVSRVGFKWNHVGENVAYGMENPMPAWIKSEGHKRNLLSRDFQMFGYAVAHKGRSPYHTQVFAKDNGGVRNIPTCGGKGSPQVTAPKPQTPASKPSTKPATGNQRPPSRGIVKRTRSSRPVRSNSHRRPTSIKKRRTVRRPSRRPIFGYGRRH